MAQYSLYMNSAGLGYGKRPAATCECKETLCVCWDFMNILEKLHSLQQQDKCFLLESRTLVGQCEAFVLSICLNRNSLLEQPGLQERRTDV